MVFVKPELNCNNKVQRVSECKKSDKRVTNVLRSLIYLVFETVGWFKIRYPWQIDIRTIDVANNRRALGYRIPRKNFLIKSKEVALS